jgi:hypothetical protein
LSVLSNVSSAVSRFFRGNGLRQADTQRAISQDTRVSTYDLNVALYDNSIYQAWREWVLGNYFIDVTGDCSKLWLAGFFNPVKEIVDLYVSNVLPGVWGNGIEIDPLVDGKPVNPKLADPVRRIWRDSNLDTNKSIITKYAANLGTVGMRVHRTPETIPGDRSTSRVRITEDHPSRLFNIVEDGQGNVTDVCLKYDVQRNANTGKTALTDPDWQTYEVVETLTQDEFSQKIGGKEQLTDDQRRNPYGFCPYVILRHKDNGTQFGDWAYKGSEHVIHAINFRLSQNDRSIGRHMFPKWFIAAAGDKPQNIDVAGDKASYVKLTPDGPPPMMEAIVAKVDFPAALAFMMQMINQLRRRQPEMAVGDLQLYANLSGETVAQVLKQAESAIFDVRPAYDHAFIRALQMGLSIGMTDGLTAYDVGAGTGEGSGDRAYQQGLETFQFKPRPALPQTPAQQIAQAQAGIAEQSARLATAKLASNVGTDTQTTLEIGGFDEATAQEIIRRKRTQDPTLNTSL